MGAQHKLIGAQRDAVVIKLIGNAEDVLGRLGQQPILGIDQLIGKPVAQLPNIEAEAGGNACLGSSVEDEELDEFGVLFGFGEGLTAEGSHEATGGFATHDRDQFRRKL